MFSVCKGFELFCFVCAIKSYPVEDMSVFFVLFEKGAKLWGLWNLDDETVLFL